VIHLAFALWPNGIGLASTNMDRFHRTLKRLRKRWGHPIAVTGVPNTKLRNADVAENGASETVPAAVSGVEGVSNTRVSGKMVPETLVSEASEATAGDLDAAEDVSDAQE
jgi:hypothetical protein